jgi:hypothetical protein
MQLFCDPHDCIIGKTLEGVSIERPREHDTEIVLKTDAFCWINTVSQHPQTQKVKNELMAKNLVPHDVKEDCLKGTKIYVKYGVMGRITNKRHPFIKKDDRGNTTTIECKEMHAIGFIDPERTLAARVKYDEMHKLADVIKTV